MPDTSGNWVEYRGVSETSYSGTQFFDISSVSQTATPTPTSGTPGVPTPTEPSPGQPIYWSGKAIKDTFLNSREPEANYGGEGYLHVGNHANGPIKTVLVWFDLADIPAGALISEATFSLFGQGVDGEVRLDVTSLNRYWAEREASWLLAEDGIIWGRAGALDVDADREAETFLGVFKDSGQVQFYDWDVRAIVQRWVDGVGPNEGFMVLPALGTKAKETHGLYSHEYSVLLLRPQLSIVYARPAPTPTTTQTTTPTATPKAVGYNVWLPLVVED